MEQETSQKLGQEHAKQGFFLRRVKSFPVLTFTLVVLFLIRFGVISVLYFTGHSDIVEESGFSIGFLVLVIPLVYLFQWLVATWVAGKFTTETLKNKFYSHPIATILLIFVYILDLPYRLSSAGSGGGLIGMFNLFETIIYYAFVSFLWWLLICWISEKIWKTPKLHWNWYKNLIDKAFVILPALYKVVLGVMIALLIFALLFILMSGVFGYSGADLQSL